ncbi:PAS domain-containing protein [Thalassobaculum sp. OXR-137]|nr:PAS domain-containing protein [Thalassobaculum sp. OXR-137]WPZ33744.1 PAS domain-containing protein [Thalassobaculum sp. OXR-137]
MKDGAGLPKASRIDPLDLRPHLPDLFMVRVAGDGQEFTYSLIGTRITEILDRDATGRTVADTFPADHPIVEIYRLICRRRIPVRTHGQVSWVDKEYKSFESVMMPLTDDEGTVIKILGAAVYLPAP